MGNFKQNPIQPLAESDCEHATLFDVSALPPAQVAALPRGTALRGLAYYDASGIQRVTNISI